VLNLFQYSGRFLAKGESQAELVRALPSQAKNTVSDFILLFLLPKAGEIYI
jgi:hypothetical protein